MNPQPVKHAAEGVISIVACTAALRCLFVAALLGLFIQDVGGQTADSREVSRPQLTKLVFRVPSSARVTSRPGGVPPQLFELDAWIAWDGAPRWDGTEQPTESSSDLGQSFPRLVTRLLRAFHDGDTETVISLYDEPSQKLVRAQFPDAPSKAAWVEAIRQITSLTPLVLWQAPEGYICILRQETRDAKGDIHVGLTALKLDEAFRLQSGKLESDAFVQLSNGLADPLRKPVDLLANVDYLRKRLEKGPR